MRPVASSGQSVAAPRSRAFAGVVMLCLASLAACDRFSGADARVKRAELKMQQGDYAGASTDLRQTLEKAPDNAEAHRLLAAVSLRLGDAERAQIEIDRAHAAGLPAGAATDLEFRILTALGKFDELRKAAGADTTLPPGRARAYQGMAEQALGHLADAESAFEDAAARAPDDTQVGLLWASFLARQQRPDEANAVLDRILAREPDAAEPIILRADLLVAAHRFAEAREMLRHAASAGATQLSVPQQSGVLAGIVETSVLLRDVAGADSAMREMKAKAPRVAATHYLAGRIALTKGDYGTATAELRNALRVAPQNSQWRLLLSTALYGQGSLEQANVELESLIADDPGNAAARKLLAEVFLARNRPEEVGKILSSVDGAVTPDAQTDWLMGRALVQSGNTAAGIGYLERSAAADPSNLRRAGDLAAAYIAAGEREKAARTIGKIPKDKGGARRSALLMLASLDGKDAIHGRAEVERLVNDNDDDSTLLSLAGGYVAQSGDNARARELLARAIERDPANDDARLTLASIEVREGHPESAEAQFHAILAHAAGNKNAYVGLSEIALRRGNRAAAKSLLEQSIGAAPSAVEPRLRLAAMAFADSDPQRAHSFLEQIDTVAGGDASVANSVGLVLLQAALYDEALVKFTWAMERGVPDARLNAARTHMALGHSEQAERVLEAGAQANPSWAAGTTLLADLEARQGRTKEALGRVTAFRNGGGARAAADEMEGDVQLIAKHFADAASAYGRALAAGPSSRNAVKLHYARRAGRMEHAEEPLLVWLTASPGDNAVRRVLAEYYQSEGQRPAAIAQYERILLSEPAGDPVSLNNLAWLYLESSDMRALATAQRAYEIRPDMAEIADTYGWVLVQSGRSRDAVPILEKSVARARARADVEYHLAVAYARTGEPAKAKALLEPLMRLKDAWPWRADAEHLLKTLES